MNKQTNEAKNSYRIEIYIGSDNDSRKIDDFYLEKIKRWANSTFPEGYTLVRGEGYFNGNPEDSIVLQVLLDYDPNLKRQLEKLKKEIRQDSILVVKSKVVYEMV